MGVRGTKGRALLDTMPDKIFNLKSTGIILSVMTKLPPDMIYNCSMCLISMMKRRNPQGDIRYCLLVCVGVCVCNGNME